MKTNAFLRLCQCGFLALACAASADNAPLWLSATNTTTAPVGTTVRLRALADAVPEPQYYWLSNSVPIPGANGNSLFVTVNPAITNVIWSVVASNYLGRSTNGPFWVRTPTGTPTSNLWGHVTLSHPATNTVLDLLKIGGYVNGNTMLSSPALGLADVNQDGVVDTKDQNLVKDDVLGRSPLGTVNSLIVSDSANSGIPNWRKWQLGLFQSSADSDGDGVPDGAELANGTDPLDPTSLIPYGTYGATPAVTVFNLTPNPADAGAFVAGPPVTITIQKN